MLKCSSNNLSPIVPDASFTARGERDWLTLHFIMVSFKLPHCVTFRHVVYPEMAPDLPLLGRYAVSCDHIPVHSWPLFRARQLVRDIIGLLQGENHFVCKFAHRLNLLKV
jgi:hypothetical protein